MYDWDTDYDDLVEFLAHLAKQPGWVDYIRDYVRNKQQSKMYANLGKDIKERMDAKSSKAGQK
jgi:hypothetical protein